MRYEKFSYFYPPRPDLAIPPNMLGFYESNGYEAQIKKNGTGGTLDIAPDRTIIAMNRHKEAHKLWAPDAETARAFHDLPGGRYKFVAELLHSKVSGGPRHTNYINDILVADGEDLVGTTFAERQKLLARLFPHAAPHLSGGYRVIDRYTWLATNHTRRFADLFETIRRRQQPEDEGLVLKKPTAKLAFCMKPSSNSSWQVKCRLPTKNFSF